MARSRRDRTARARPELLELLRTLSFRRGRVALASGKESDFFIDCMQAVLTARGHVLAGELMLDALRNLPKCDAVAGVALGGCPLASAVSMMSEVRGRPLPALYIRKEAKDQGSPRRVEGQVTPGMRIIMLQDVITTGDATLEAVEAIKAVGAQVVGVVVLIDRLEGGIETLLRAGLEVSALYTRHDFLVGEGPITATLSDTMPE